MIQLLTMIFGAIGPAGIGSIVKVFSGWLDSKAALAEQREKRELVRELQNRELDNGFQNSVFGSGEQAHRDGRVNRRIALVIGMCTFAVCQILCVLWPGHQLITFSPPEFRESINIAWGLFTIPSGKSATVVITTGHLAFMGFQMISMMFGFYFTPGGRK